MWMQIKAAVVSAAFLAGAVGIACAQGSSTQDPGSLTPGNLTFQDLGQATRLPGAYGTSDPAGTVTGTGMGTNSTGFGAANTSGFGGNAAGSRR
jgi:hypothetical protein